jgi:hypothetical protein
VSGIGRRVQPLPLSGSLLGSFQRGKWCAASLAGAAPGEVARQQG